MQKSTIGRSIKAPAAAAPPRAVSVAAPGPRRDTSAEATASQGEEAGPVPGWARSVARLLERTSPGLAGRVGERLWFRVPAPPSRVRRERHVPPGGEPFTVASGDVAVRGRVYGHWGNPTAYLVHGWGGWWQQLAAFVEPLVGAGLCVVAADLPGHGESGRGRHGRRSTDVLEMSDALTSVVREFGRPTLVVAHSLGAMAAVQALRTGVRPEAYAFVAPPRSAEPLVAQFAQALGLGPRSAAQLRRRIEQRAGTALAALDLVDVAAEQPSLPALLVVHDRADRETAASGSVELTTAWHDARLLLTDGLGHRRPLWDPVVVERVTDLAVAAAAKVRRSSR